MHRWLYGLVLLLCSFTSFSQTNDQDPGLHSVQESLGHIDARLTRQVNELLWRQELGQLAIIDKVRFTGPAPRGTNDLPPSAGSNEVVVSALTFMPRKHGRTLPLIVFAHGEIHGNVATDEDVHVLRELLEQGYAVIAPDYRGSSGYGSDYWHLIDYGGLEIEDVHAARQFMLQRHRELDPRRVAIVGWSHGGAIALLTVFAHPNDYCACYAGVPVSDLIERIRILGKGYEELFAAPYHIGKTVEEAPEEYRRRSPAWNAAKLQTPLLIQANTNDQDVNINEIHRLISALREAGKNFSWQVYTNAPGGHYFNRLDTVGAHESRAEIWGFLARYLHPPKPYDKAKIRTSKP
jgi:dipeptidyl aminopeptidase/acylaminoacyl peptidase